MSVKNSYLIVILAYLALIANGKTTVSLRLQVVSYSSAATDACIGGDVGLTGNSILVQYRLITSLRRTTEWRLLDEIDPQRGLNGTFDLPPLQDLPLGSGVQFRLLQLEHGGGSCNCWMLEEAVVVWNNLVWMILFSEGIASMCL